MAEDSRGWTKRGQLNENYAPVDEFGQERKPRLRRIPSLRGDSLEPPTT